MELSSSRQIRPRTAVRGPSLSGECFDGLTAPAPCPCMPSTSKPHLPLPVPQMAGSLLPRGPGSRRSPQHGREGGRDGSSFQRNRVVPVERRYACHPRSRRSRRSASSPAIFSPCDACAHFRQYDAGVCRVLCQTPACSQIVHSSPQT